VVVTIRATHQEIVPFIEQMIQPYVGETIQLARTYGELIGF
jgi:hypothetical protein